jgi:hypothetical protein
MSFLNTLAAEIEKLPEDIKTAFGAELAKAKEAFATSEAKIESEIEHLRSLGYAVEKSATVEKSAIVPTTESDATTSGSTQPLHE